MWPKRPGFKVPHVVWTSAENRPFGLRQRAMRLSWACWWDDRGLNYWMAAFTMHPTLQAAVRETGGKQVFDGSCDLGKRVCSTPAKRSYLHARRLVTSQFCRRANRADEDIRGVSGEIDY